jgi:TonB-linked SusC/RagA family outer membrane protein
MKKIMIALLCTFIVGGAFAQVKLGGKVSDDSGTPIPGVTITVKGTTQGTVTDIDGNYSLTSTAPKGTLVFSFIGMQSMEKAFEGNAVFNVTMQKANVDLDEVVAIGYGTVRKKDLTGAVASVKSEEIKMNPVTNPIEAMQGRVAGLDITRESGKANSESNVLLRGNRSLTASSEPIYIIDGIQGSVNNLNPNDIVSIDILKDASSTAIYGSAGANGVIIITTKQAKEGKIQVDFDAYMSINGWASYPSALQGDSWLNYLEEGYYATNGSHSSSQDELLTAWGLKSDYLDSYISEGKWIDWVDETLKTGTQQNYAISVRGGTERIQTSFSLGYNRTDGIYKNDYVDKFTMRGNTVITATKWAKFGITTGLIFKNSETRSSRINKAFGTVPLGEVYDEDGNINTYPISEDESIISLLADDIDGTYKNNTKSIAITTNPYAEFTLMKGLTFKSILGTSLSASRQGIFNSDHTYMMLIGSSTAIRNATYETKLGYSYTWENIANYNLKLSDHDITATLISSYAQSKNEESSSYSEGFLYDEFLFYNLDAGSSQTASSDYSETKHLSFAGRLNYSYKGKYLLTGSVRYDGASQLVKKWDVFPAGALAWRISDEEFMAGTKNWLSNLKLRTGYGVSGNSNIEAYQTTSQVTSGSDLLNLGSGQVTTSIPTQAVGNTSLGWEKSYNFNFGLDFGFFNSRIDGSLELYDTDTRDVLYERSLPFTGGGFTPKTAYTMYQNIARMHNKGVELTLNTRNIQTKDFQWTSTITFARDWEEVKSIDLGSGTTVDDLISLGLFLGSPKNTYYDYKKIGIWQTDEAADAAVFGLLPGDSKVESSLTKVSDGVWVQKITDDNGNVTETEYTASNPYTINSTNDKQIIGQGTPKWTAGFQNTFTYKNFDLNIFTTARWGQMINGGLLGYFDYGKINLPNNYDYWTEDNPTNDYPRPYLSRPTLNYSKSTLGLTYVNGSYVKIKNITLGYTLPKTLNKKIGLSNLRVYGTVYNPIIITKSHLLNGVDPETGASDSFPLYKQLVFGVNVSF